MTRDEIRNEYCTKYLTEHPHRHACDFAQHITKLEREAIIKIIESHQISVGNSSAGEIACEMTYDNLHSIRATIRARGE